LLDAPFAAPSVVALRPFAKHGRVSRWRGLCVALSILPSKEAVVARAVISDPKRRTAYEPLYDIDPQTGASVEIFYADRVLATSFGTRGAGWFWWACQPACLPDCPPIGPFATSYTAYRNFALDRGVASTTCIPALRAR
jgi:hypothetical protein